jgi:hypothetical protein
VIGLLRKSWILDRMATAREWVRILTHGEAAVLGGLCGRGWLLAAAGPLSSSSWAGSLESRNLDHPERLKRVRSRLGNVPRRIVDLLIIAESINDLRSVSSGSWRGFCSYRKSFRHRVGSLALSSTIGRTAEDSMAAAVEKLSHEIRSRGARVREQVALGIPFAGTLKAIKLGCTCPIHSKRADPRCPVHVVQRNQKAKASDD